MNEMIERVAKVVFVLAPDGGWPSPDHPRCVYIATRIIEAMREPTGAMIDRGESNYDADGINSPIANSWRAMVDEALK